MFGNTLRRSARRPINGGSQRILVTQACHRRESRSDGLLFAGFALSIGTACVYMVTCEPRRLNTQPRNVMLHRKRSLRGRSLNDKYKVEWNTVLGEGAYGSVHPARLAATGEKVALKKISRRYTNSTAFKAETDALLRIFDNGGHPNISGLRGRSCLVPLSSIYDSHRSLLKLLISDLT